MCSFYHLPSTVIGHAKHRTLNAAYSFYNVATTVRENELSTNVSSIIRFAMLETSSGLLFFFFCTWQNPRRFEPPLDDLSQPRRELCMSQYSPPFTTCVVHDFLFSVVSHLVDPYR